MNKHNIQTIGIFNKNCLVYIYQLQSDISGVLNGHFASLTLNSQPGQLQRSL